MPRFDVEIIFALPADRPDPISFQGIKAQNVEHAIELAIDRANKAFRGVKGPEVLAASAWPAGQAKTNLPLTRVWRIG